MCVCVWQCVGGVLSLCRGDWQLWRRAKSSPPAGVISDILLVCICVCVCMYFSWAAVSSSSHCHIVHALILDDAPSIKYGFSHIHLAQPKTCQREWERKRERERVSSVGQQRRRKGRRRRNQKKNMNSSICAGCREKNSIFWQELRVFKPTSPHRWA